MAVRTPWNTIESQEKPDWRPFLNQSGEPIGDAPVGWEWFKSDSDGWLARPVRKDNE